MPIGRSTTHDPELAGFRVSTVLPCVYRAPSHSLALSAGTFFHYASVGSTIHGQLGLTTKIRVTCPRRATLRKDSVVDRVRKAVGPARAPSTVV